MRARFAILLMLLFSWFVTEGLVAEQRFPPPDFESGYKLPATQTPLPRSLALQYLDVVVLAVGLGLACDAIFRKRSRRWVMGLSLGSVLYFGFYRQGCICAIGSIQNVTRGLFDSAYAIPLTALAFFLLPLVVALFAGRAFCAAVCPHGALQDLVLLRPIRVPPWLEHGLGVLPFLYLGAGVMFAATGSAWVICRYDPFVPLFRMSGSIGMVVSGAALLLAGIFVGRPYCRFLCPYGALLRMASTVSKWRVSITPDTCTQCRLCEDSCPYNAIQYPVQSAMTAERLGRDRRRLAWILIGLVPFISAGTWLGVRLSPLASQLHPAVALSETYLRAKQQPAGFAPQTAGALALSRAEQDPTALVRQAMAVQQKFRWAGGAFGAWASLVIGLKLVFLSLRYKRTDYQPDRGGCLACARCFTACPSERLRCGSAAVTGPGGSEPIPAGTGAIARSWNQRLSEL